MLANQTLITSVHDHRSGYLYLPPLMLAARNPFELVPVLRETIEICARRRRRLDFFKSSMCHQDSHEPCATQHSEPHAPDGLVRWVAYR